MARRLVVAFLSGVSGPTCSRGIPSPQTSLPSQLGLLHHHCSSSLGVELRHVSMENSSPHRSTSQTSANLSPSPGPWTPKALSNPDPAPRPPTLPWEAKTTLKMPQEAGRDPPSAPADGSYHGQPSLNQFLEFHCKDDEIGKPA